MYPIYEELPASVLADDDEARKREVRLQEQKTEWLAEEREARARKINEGENDGSLHSYKRN